MPFQQFSPFGTLQTIVCNKQYAGIGVQVAPTNGSLTVAQVFDGSPAEKAGLKAHDVITAIDGQAVNGLPPAQAIEKLRGPVNSKVNLTIAREGQNNAVEFTITRESIQMQSTQLGPPK